MRGEKNDPSCCYQNTTENMDWTRTKMFKEYAERSNNARSVAIETSYG